MYFAFNKGTNDILAVPNIIHFGIDVAGSSVAAFHIPSVVHGYFVCCTIFHSECLANYVGHALYEFTTMDSLRYDIDLLARNNESMSDP